MALPPFCGQEVVNLRGLNAFLAGLGNLIPGMIQHTLWRE